MMSMRPKSPAFDPFSITSDGGSGASWKPPKENLFAASDYSSGGGGSGTQHKPYQRFPPDDVPFDQEASVEIQDAAPSFDEATDLSSDAAAMMGNNTAPSYFHASDDSMRQPPETPPTSRPNHPLPWQQEEQEQELPPPNPRLQHHPLAMPQESLAPQQEQEEEDESWDDYEKKYREAEKSEMDYHNNSFEDYGFSNPNKPPKKEYKQHTVYQELDSIGQQQQQQEQHPKQEKTLPPSILKRRTVASDAEQETRNKNKEDRKRNSRRRSSRKQRLEQQQEEDDTSLEVYPQSNLLRKQHSDSVARRTQEAFEKRQNGVSFQKRHQVHHYPQEEEEDDDDETNLTGWTGNTGNSEYSKSMESEVEDLVKDLFFIGEATKPGSRKSRSSSRFKQGDETVGESTIDSHDDATLNTLDDYTNFGDESTFESTMEESTIDNPKLKSTTSSPQEDPFSSMWHMMAGGFSAVGAALGIQESEEEKKKKKKKPQDPQHEQQERRALQAEETLDQDGLDNSQNSTLTDMLDMASGFLLGPTDSLINSRASQKSLETDSRLAELALHAARSKHEIHGIVFDESSEIDVMAEVKFSVVQVLLPMGILFQENDGGCWVTKVFASGNAAMRAKGGSVQVGDQLAAINGTSAIQMKVDKICSLVSEVPKDEEVELTFLRYTGPMRPAPGTIREEGYEVRDSDIERSGGAGKKKCWMPSRPRKVKIESKRTENKKPTQKKRFRLFGRKKNT